MNNTIRPSNRVVVLGAGMVGSTIAYSILNQQLAKEILMIDINNELAQAQVWDLEDAAHFSTRTGVKVADYSDILDGDIVIITSGASQQAGETRSDLLNVNSGIIRNVARSIHETGKIVYILMVTNPVDVMTYVAIMESGLPEGLVFGSGTYLDTARLRQTISEDIKVSSDNIHAYVLGEHGDSSFPVLSSANVQGIPLGNFIELDETYYKKVGDKVRKKAYDIIKGKKSTYFGIASTASKICRAILRDENRLAPLSVQLKGAYGQKDVIMGVPAKITTDGVRIVGELAMNEFERTLFEQSAEVVRKNIALV